LAIAQGVQNDADMIETRFPDQLEMDVFDISPRRVPSDGIPAEDIYTASQTGILLKTIQCHQPACGKYDDSDNRCNTNLLHNIDVGLSHNLWVILV
jgi:hypothetical protein